MAMIRRGQKLFVVLMGAITGFSLHAIADYPMPYTPPTLDIPIFGMKDKMTGLEVSFHWGTANSSLDDVGERTGLFNNHGPIKFKQWASANYAAGDIKTLLTYLETNHASEDRSIIAKGELDFYQATVTAKHFFESGLFGQARLPFRALKTYGIELEAEPGSSTSTACATYIKNNLDTVLASLNIEPWQS
jgi:hypothetical protein